MYILKNYTGASQICCGNTAIDHTLNITCIPQTHTPCQCVISNELHPRLSYFPEGIKVYVAFNQQ